jgi:CRISPR-associated protein Cmr1
MTAMTAHPGPHTTDELEIALAAPAFLGGADQSAEWRTPPLKALLRQCWRIVAAKQLGYDWQRVREQEGRLFGNAWLTDKECRSQVTLVLDSWAQGAMHAWPSEPKVRHPEVPFPVGAHLYLGYGPLTYDKTTKKAALNSSRTALHPSQTATLHLRFPASERATLDKALHLAHLIGAIGGRSRNGWGSIVLKRQGQQLPGVKDPSSSALLRDVSRPLAACLREPWPHAIGTDDKGLLLWATKPQRDQSGLMQTLAELKIGFRTHFPFPGGGPHQKACDRHVLAYPVTKHELRGWREGRLANSLRFKIVDDGEAYTALVVHLPCAPPERLLADFTPPRIQGIWEEVHACLDRDERLQRV